ncbi:MAG TPA: transglutaminase family protein [Candidatus Limnocylindria bacterium]|nr:transglutaminase family protein [Candidatus Limnocylindria bacterium]
MKPLEGVAIDWSSARRASFQITQSFRYEYPSPIRNLNHRLVVIPPERFGDQRRVRHSVSAGAERVRFENRQDRFGNVIVDAFAPRISSAIEFLAEVSVERSSSEPNRLPRGWQEQSYLLEPTLLTAADPPIDRVADELREKAEWGLDLADRINDWVYQSITYKGGITGVRTTAAEALAQGFGVCQDYAHIMLAICRSAELPSRYVSGHLVGQGGTHAWVEVILPVDDESGDAIAWAFDPTHASRGGLEYVTIAVGADYSDVAPTSGTYQSRAAGRLVTSKRVTLTDVEYAI